MTEHTEITATTNKEVSTTGNTPLLELITKLVTNKDINVDALDKLLSMQERVLDKQGVIDFNTNFPQMQAELEPIQKNGQAGYESKKDGSHVGYKWASKEDINKAITPVLAKHGFGVRFETEQNGNEIIVIAILSHKGGHSVRTQIKAPPDTSGGKTSVQAIGSTLTYNERYCLKQILNLTFVDDPSDDDGQATPPPPMPASNDQKKQVALAREKLSDEFRIRFDEKFLIEDLSESDIPIILKAIEKTLQNMEKEEQNKKEALK